MGNIALIKAIRTWATEHGELVKEIKSLKGAKCLAERLHEDFFEAVETERARLCEEAQDLRLKLRVAEAETERLRGGVTGLLNEQDGNKPMVSGDQLRDVLNYVISVQNDLEVISGSKMPEYYQEIHSAFQEVIVEINSMLWAWAEELANIAHVSSAAGSVIDYVEC